MMTSPLSIQLEEGKSLLIELAHDPDCEHRFSLLNVDEHGSSSRYITRAQAVQTCESHENPAIQKIGRIIALYGDTIPLPVLLPLISSEQYGAEHVTQVLYAHCIGILTTGNAMLRHLVFEGRMASTAVLTDAVMRENARAAEKHGPFSHERARVAMVEIGSELRRLAELVPDFASAPRA